MSHGVQRLLRIGRNTADLDRAIAFYCDALGFHVDDAAPDIMPAWTQLPGMDATPPRVARLLLGSQQLELTEFSDTAAYPPDGTSADLSFQHCAIVVSDVAAVCKRVIQKGATPITREGPQTLPPSTGSVTAFKFRDPDGHPLESIHFPPGTGDPAWQRAPVDPELPSVGLDHSAISIGDVERSIAFYQLLGLQVAARGVNHGAEQQRLDDLSDAKVDVIAMQPTASHTPHLELLGYRTSHARVAKPPPLTAIAADRLTWQATNLDVLLDAITDADFTDAILTVGRAAGGNLAVLRDPDGHLSVLCESGSITS